MGSRATCTGSEGVRCPLWGPAGPCTLERSEIDDMEVLKQLEEKLQALLNQRNELRGVVARLNTEANEAEDQIASLRRRVEELELERDMLQEEREEIRGEVASLLKLAEDLG